MTAEPSPGHQRELIDRRPAGREVGDHLRRHRGGVGRHALRRDAVIAGEHQDVHPVEPRHRAALPAGEPRHQVLESAEAAGRLGQHGLALAHRVGRDVVRARQIEAGVAQPVERDHRGSSARDDVEEELPLTRPLRPPAGPSGLPSPSAEIAERRVSAGVGKRRVVDIRGRAARLRPTRSGNPHAAPLPGSRDGGGGERSLSCDRAARPCGDRPGPRPQALAEHHEAAALAMHRPVLGEAGEPGPESPGSREAARMQLGVAAREPAGIAVGRRRLVGQRRERRRFRRRRARHPASRCG